MSDVFEKNGKWFGVNDNGVQRRCRDKADAERWAFNDVVIEEEDPFLPGVFDDEE